MSSASIAGQALKSLTPEEWSVLTALERAIGAYEVVPIEHLAKNTRLHIDEVRFRLKRLDQMRLIHLSTRGATLISAGLDALALRGFVKHNLITKIGPMIGVGKEADIYEATDGEGILYAVKFYRIGRISFRSIRVKRGYVNPLTHHQWLKVNINVAKREFEVVNRLRSVGVAVPETIRCERHAILMKRIYGRLLAECKDLKTPKKTLQDILRNIRIAYTDAGIINADLSEFNILYGDREIWIIDWPQAVDKKHPNAQMLLDRDVLNILKFFRRRFGLECPLEDASFYVRGWRGKIDIYTR